MPDIAMIDANANADPDPNAASTSSTAPQSHSLSRLMGTSEIQRPNTEECKSCRRGR
jgi:hypothetical protein